MTWLLPRCVQTLEVYEGLNFAREALTRLRRPTGKPTSPGLTCRDIKEHNPDFKSGESATGLTNS